MIAAPKNEVTLIRVLAAPREKVWRAFREPEALKQWWGLPRGAAMLTCDVDFRVGGTFLCEIQQPGWPRIWFKWIYREIIEGAWVVLEQHFSDAAGSERVSPDRPVSTITLRFEDFDGKTKLTVTQAGMASEKYSAEMYREGWSESLDRLAECLDL